MIANKIVIPLLVLLLAACQILPIFPQPVKPTATPPASTKAPGMPEPFVGTPKGGAVTPTLAPFPSPGRFKIQPLAALAPYGAQAGSPRYITNFARIDKGCNWMGAAGQIFELNRQPAINFVVVIAGTLAGSAVDAVGLSGSASMYGPGGYEVVFSDKVLNSTGTLRIQLFDLAGAPLSDPVAINTVADCQKNLIIFNFMRYPGPFRFFYPWIGRE